MSPFAKILITLLVLVAGLLVSIRRFPGLSPRLKGLRERTRPGYYAAVLGAFAVVILLIYTLASRKVAWFLTGVIVLYILFRRIFPALGRAMQRWRRVNPAAVAFVVRAVLVVLIGLAAWAVYADSIVNAFSVGLAALFVLFWAWGGIAPSVARFRRERPAIFAGLVWTVLVAVVVLLGLFVTHKAPILALLLLAGWWLTMRGIPWVVTKVGRLLGFRMQPTPLTERRILRFKRITRGYVCFVLVMTAFVLSIFLELYVNRRPLYIRWSGETYEDVNGDGTWNEGEPLADRNGNGTWDGEKALYPAVANWLDTWIPFLNLKEESRAVAEDFGMKGKGEVPYRTYARWVDDPNELEKDARKIEQEIVQDEASWRAGMAKAAERKGDTFDMDSPLPEYKVQQYDAMRAEAADLRALQKDFESGRAKIVMTLHPYSFDEQLLDLEGSPPHRAFSGNPEWPVLGTDFEGKEVLSQLFYGFRVSFLFAVVVAFIGFSIGISVGAIMGYFGGWTDIIVQRIIEVWSSIPFLFTLMILGSITTPTFLILAVMLVVLRSWLGITYTIRGEYYREKARDYVQAARALGVRRPKIMARHIFPNALVPVVTFMPFAIVSYIGILVSLDYLGFGLGPDTPSWGSLLRQGGENIVQNQQLVWWPILAFSLTLFCVVMIGEAVREAFDPKLYSRLR